MTDSLVVLNRRVPGGIAKASGLDDGPTHTPAAIVKGQALGDATRTRHNIAHSLSQETRTE